MHVWSVTVLPAHLDALLADLKNLDPTRLVIIRTPGKLRQTVQFFTEDPQEALQIQKAHAGRIEEAGDSWKTAASGHAPIRIRDRFLIVEKASTPSKSREIVIPAGLAFGTGDHPTTASCLRLLCDASASFRGRKWTVLDVGTGSGVLAIAARKLGAAAVEGFDYDPISIRTARQNARLNSVRGIQWSRQDLLSYTARKNYNVVAANIFSELLLASWPRIHPAIAPGGFFILSGILRFQAAECRAAIQAAGFEIKREVRLGKWVTFLAVSVDTKAK